MKKTKPAAPLTNEQIDAAAATPTPADIYAQKKHELLGIGNAIELYARDLTDEEKIEVNKLNDRMQAQLEELTIALAVAEIEIKLPIMTQVLEIMRRKEPKPKKTKK